MDIQEAIKNYQPSNETVELVRSSDLLLISGIVGAGKDTVIKELLSDDRFRPIISHTTRMPRQNHGIMEVDHQDYHFIGLDEAAQLVHDEAFVEVKYVHGNVYGTSVAEIKKINDAGKIATTDIDIQGVMEYLELKPDTKAIFLLPPSVDTWLARLERRYGEIDYTNIDFKKRLATALTEITHIKSDPRFVLVINDDLATTVDRIKKVVAGEREATSEYAEVITEHLLEFLERRA